MAIRSTINPPIYQSIAMVVHNDDIIVVSQNGTRRAGCDESSGWVWYAARQLERVLVQMTNHDIKGLRILEVGSGTGWLALRLALRGALVTATDRPGALPLLLRNVYSNQEQLCGSTAGGVVNELLVDVYELEWTSETRLEGEWDLAIGSDVLYLVEYHRLLLETFVRHDCKHCVVAWEQRKADEEEGFLSLAQELGFEIKHRIDAGVNPVTNNPVWVAFLEFGGCE
jgi:predicted nicotinamide N-methyase